MKRDIINIELKRKPSKKESNQQWRKTAWRNVGNRSEMSTNNQWRKSVKIDK
jgi:hypothetical protein